MYTNKFPSLFSNHFPTTTIIKETITATIAAIYTDFDGFDGVEILEIKKAEEMERLWEALKAKGFTEAQIERIAYGNVKRVLQAL